MFFKLLIIFIIFLGAKAQNYCDPQLCRRQQHIACNNNGQFAQGCRGQMINIETQINLILQLHNERRNQIAGGSLSPYPAALQMATMSWDPELARIAVFNAVRCRMEHDNCRNTNQFRFAGQNLGILFTRNAVDTPTFLRQNIAAWFDEYSAASRADIDRFTVLERNGRQIGHFTVMVNEKNNRVGCAISQFTDARNTQATYLVCNYAVTNVLNNPVYRVGATASQCTTGRNPALSNLCSVNEVYNPNQWSG